MIIGLSLRVATVESYRDDAIDSVKEVSQPKSKPRRACNSENGIRHKLKVLAAVGHESLTAAS